MKTILLTIGAAFFIAGIYWGGTAMFKWAIPSVLLGSMFLVLGMEKK